MRDQTYDRNKTIFDFGEQWTRHKKNTGRYASLEQFEDIVAPFLSRADFQHRRCADIGSGNGPYRPYAHRRWRGARDGH
jgi:hypothetical protein